MGKKYVREPSQLEKGYQIGTQIGQGIAGASIVLFIAYLLRKPLGILILVMLIGGSAGIIISLFMGVINARESQPLRNQLDTQGVVIFNNAIYQLSSSLKNKIFDESLYQYFDNQTAIQIKKRVEEMESSGEQVEQDIFVNNINSVRFLSGRGSALHDADYFSNVTYACVTVTINGQRTIRKSDGSVERQDNINENARIGLIRVGNNWKIVDFYGLGINVSSDRIITSYCY